MIRKNDKVLILLGKDRAKTGTVERVLPKKNQVVVAGLNLIKKHTRPTRRNPKGGVSEIPAPIHISNVMLICPKCGKATRIGKKIIGKKKLRICKKCSEAI
jgi:large subunit ribosomal protein L24